MRKLIKVKQNHIDKGEKGYGSCPIYLALIENGFKNWMVGSRSFWVLNPNGMPNIIVKSPRSVQRFITKHDCGKKTKPFNFYFDLLRS